METPEKNELPATPLLCEPFSRALKTQREKLNQLFVQQSHLAGGIDGQRFLQHLAENVNPIIASISAVLPECVAQSSLGLYELSLHLFANRIIGTGSHHRPIVRAWRELLPKIPKLVSRDSTNVAGTIANVVYNLNLQPGVNTKSWIDQMIEISPHLDSTPQLLDCAQVLAWRHGMVQYRKDAITTAKKMDHPLACHALGVPDATPAELARLLDHVAELNWADLSAEPWTDLKTQPQLEIVGQIGQFRGFEGQFIHPPVVLFQDGCLVVSDAESSWQILADRYGSLVHRIGTGLGTVLKPKRSKQESVEVDEQGNVLWNENRGSFDELRTASYWATDGQTLAVTLTDSHHVYLLALV